MVFDGRIGDVIKPLLEQLREPLSETKTKIGEDFFSFYR